MSRNCYEIAHDDYEVRKIYWDFESYLSALSCSLDALAHVVGTAYDHDGQPLPSYNTLCRKNQPTRFTEIFCKAEQKWAKRLRSYRNCFVHWTPIDTDLTINMRLHRNKWDLRCGLPTNPEVCEIDGFRYTRRAELLRYSISLWNEMLGLDHRVAREINRAYAAGEYPKRISDLFFTGASKKTRPQKFTNAIR